ncbi:antibiotic ABC transporter ATP-binding protein, partial [Streptomyces sp. MBRL 601]
MENPARARTALLAHDLVRVLGGRRVLDGVCLTAAPGRRIGLIGENGVGKSTLLRLLAGTDRPDSGHVVRPADLGVLHQELPYDPASTLAEVLAGALREARVALTELDRLTGLLETTPQDTPEYAALLTAYGRQLESAERQEVWEADRRAAAVLAGLGLGALDHGRSLASLS